MVEINQLERLHVKHAIQNTRVEKKILLSLKRKFSIIKKQTLY